MRLSAETTLSSQQEPRLLAFLSNEKNLIKTYNEKKDLYATIGSMIFKKDYWECMEHWQDGSPNPVGKNIRKKCKTIVLGISYGMGAKLMAEKLGIPIEECKDILNEFYTMFPAVKEFTKKNEEDAVSKGYVEDYFGRRRHLPDARLEELEFKAKEKLLTNMGVFLDSTIDENFIEVCNEEESKNWKDKWNSYRKNQAKYKDNYFDIKAKFKKKASENNVEIHDNGMFISRTSTQCTNARIQGSAATLTKKAMVCISNDEEMKNLGFRLLVPVHDELLGECPVENKEKVEKRLSELMISAAKPECTVDMKVDTYVVNHWYADELFSIIHNEYIALTSSPKIEDEKSFKKMCHDYPALSILCDKFDNLRSTELDFSEEEVFNAICKEYPAFSENIVREMCDNTFDTMTEEICFGN